MAEVYNADDLVPVIERVLKQRMTYAASEQTMFASDEVAREIARALGPIARDEIAAQLKRLNELHVAFATVLQGVSGVVLSTSVAVERLEEPRSAELQARAAADTTIITAVNELDLLADRMGDADRDRAADAAFVRETTARIRTALGEDDVKSA